MLCPTIKRRWSVCEPRLYNSSIQWKMVDQEMKWPCCILLFSVMVMLSPVLIVRTVPVCLREPTKAHLMRWTYGKKTPRKRANSFHLDWLSSWQADTKAENFCTLYCPGTRFQQPVPFHGQLQWLPDVDVVLGTHDYMLYYPHNFIVISIMTMGIITHTVKRFRLL